ncbi:sensor histidine kinase [Streptomyces piniterrae]|uniref:sensor histidine kinase n=1 Tax=Streptomyces piniterrae TaxID=2571125 RepID=UPI001FEB02AD|nr:histidine kinase [Streptomyces piniterrae]
MIGRVRTQWRSRSRLAQVDTYFRWTLYLLPWFTAIGGVAPIMGRTTGGEPLAVALASTALALNVTQGFLAIRLFDRALQRYLKQGETPLSLMIVSGVLTLTAEIALFALLAVRGIGDEDAMATVILAAAATLTPFFKAYSLLVSKRRYMASLAGADAGLILVAGLLTQGWLAGAMLALLLTTAALWSFVIARPSGWMLAVIWELDVARKTQAQLAVAEERLRFGRDLHDVMGRNLAVIALKSELAVQLARRERPEAVAQMVEVQRIAQESQREVREVVRGYRKADLQAELAGARSILRAAGVDCQIEGEEGIQLPAEMESALGWVVREATTNVLRHAAEARHCVLRTRVDRDRDVLVMTMDNDGVVTLPGDATAPQPGSGLKGLQERLDPLNGTLASGPCAKGSYRLTVELPVATEGDTRQRGPRRGLGTKRAGRVERAATRGPGAEGDGRGQREASRGVGTTRKARRAEGIAGAGREGEARGLGTSRSMGVEEG